MGCSKKFTHKALSSRRRWLHGLLNTHVLTLKIFRWNSVSTRGRSHGLLAAHTSCHYCDETSHHKQLPAQGILMERSTFPPVFIFKSQRSNFKNHPLNHLFAHTLQLHCHGFGLAVQLLFFFPSSFSCLKSLHSLDCSYNLAWEKKSPLSLPVKHQIHTQLIFTVAWPTGV